MNEIIFRKQLAIFVGAALTIESDVANANYIPECTDNP